MVKSFEEAQLQRACVKALRAAHPDVVVRSSYDSADDPKIGLQSPFRKMSLDEAGGRSERFHLLHSKVEVLLIRTKISIKIKTSTKTRISTRTKIQIQVPEQIAVVHQAIREQVHREEALIQEHLAVAPSREFRTRWE